MFGGDGGVGSNLGDLWVFDPLQNKWKWLSGTKLANQTGNYGSLGVASPSNLPPCRMGAVAWWGNDNKFYMFGGTQSATIADYSDVWVFDPDTNCIPTCNVVTVLPPHADLKADKTVICTYDCINFTDLSTNATSWKWSFSGGTPSSSTDENPQNICYQVAGTYNVKLIAYNAGGSDSVTFSNYIIVSDSPPLPSITQSHDTLFCSFDPSYTSYQWYDSTALVSGAVNTFYVASHSGNYNVRVTNENGCSIAVGINIIIEPTGVQSILTDNLNVMIVPNPAGNQLTVYGLQFTVNRIELYDVLGQQVCSEQEAINNKEGTVINVSGLSPGIYFVQLKGESINVVKRFVKE